MATALDQPAYNQTPQRPQTQAYPVNGATPPPFDINAIMAMIAQMQQAQGQTRLQGQRERIAAQNPLGAVAQANSRMPGLTPQAQWDGMFQGHDARVASESRALGQPGYLGTSQDHISNLPEQAAVPPPTMSPGDAAAQASRQLPYAAELRGMQPQNPFIGQAPPHAQYAGPGNAPNFTNPPRAEFVAPPYTPPPNLFGPSLVRPTSPRPGFSFGAGVGPR